MMYRVTASALNLREAPSPTAERRAVIPHDATVNDLDETAPTPGWRKLLWRGEQGYASTAFLQPLAGDDPVVSGAPSNELPAAPPVDKTDRDTAKLHPVVREKVLKTVATLNGEGLPFRIFEAFRTPERQTYLFAQGRTRPGGIVTRSQAWQSMHQYGLAVDLVLFLDSGWSWQGKPGDWARMHQVAKDNGLQWLSFEAPHVELTGADWHAYEAGRLPPGGDDSWYDALSVAAERWRRGGHQPSAPPIAFAERPPLDDQGPSADTDK